MDEVFICKIASFQEMNIKWNYEIAQREKDKVKCYTKVVTGVANEI